MKKNQFLSALFVSTFLIAGSTAIADDTQSGADPVTSIKSEKKPTRKKKAQMCNECGKPEKECECHDNDNKKDTKSEDAKKENKAD